MVSSPTALNLDELSQSLVDLSTQFCLASPRERRREGDLKEVEFLTLSLLHQHDTLIVGDIQRQLGVLPAQMSRIIRSLETREPALVTCQINAHDKRKINVTMTPAGRQSLHDHQASRMRHIARVLGQLPDEDLHSLRNLIYKIQDLLNPILDR